MRCIIGRMKKVWDQGIPGYENGIERLWMDRRCDVSCKPNNKSWFSQDCDVKVSTILSKVSMLMELWVCSCADIYLLVVQRMLVGLVFLRGIWIRLFRGDMEKVGGSCRMCVPIPRTFYTSTTQAPRSDRLESREADFTVSSNSLSIKDSLLSSCGNANCCLHTCQQQPVIEWKRQ